MISASHDLRADAVYITLDEGPVTRTVDLDSGTLVDLHADGHPIGLEVIHPHRQWPLDQFIRMFNISDEASRGLRAIAQSFAGPTPSFGRARETSSGSAKLTRFRPVTA